MWNWRGKTPPAQAQTAARGRAASRAETEHLLPQGGRQRRPCPRWAPSVPRTPLALSIYSACPHWPISGNVVSPARRWCPRPRGVPSHGAIAAERASGAGRQQVSKGLERGCGGEGQLLPCGVIHLRALHDDALPQMTRSVPARL